MLIMAFGVADISIHAPRTGSDPRSRSQADRHHQISIHAPRTGSDTPEERKRVQDAKFQSTLPARGATDFAATHSRQGDISIHAPRTGSDTASRSCCTCWRNFNPRSPHGERHCGMQ